MSESAINFDEVVEKYSKNIYNLAFRMVGNIEDAEDIVQDTFYLAYKNIDKFEAKSSIYTWIYRICTNECLRQRKKKSQKYIELFDDNFSYKESNDTTNWINNPENIVAVKELTEFIRHECHQIVMERLTESQRLVFIMRVILEMSYSDIAEILEIDENTVKARLNRARNSLLKHFESDCNWFKTGGDSSCCKNKLGYALSLDIDILKKVDESFREYSDNKETQANDDKTIEYIYQKLPLLDYKHKINI